MMINEGLLQLRELNSRIFTGATGALALSVTFKANILASSPGFGWLLSSAWVLLTISILAHLWAQFSHGLFFLSAGIGAPKEELKSELNSHKWSFVTTVLSFSFGVVALCLFAVLNNS